MSTTAAPEKFAMTWEDAVQWLRTQPDQELLAKFCYFDDPLMESVERYSESPEWQAVAKFLPQHPGMALDLGAGRGISSYAFGKLGWSVIALEPDPSTLVGGGAIKEIATQTGYDINVVSEFGLDFPFGNGTFDVVYGRQVLHHAPDLKHFVKEAFRVLKPGGIFIATREHVLTRREDLGAFLDSHPLHKLYGGENAYLLPEYLDAITGAGFELKESLGSFDNVINYYPVTEQELDNQRHWQLKQKYGTFVANQLMTNPLLKNFGRKLGTQLCTSQDNTPGRLYSFVAVKR
jgi:SAM-dependent methyltransferase